MRTLILSLAACAWYFSAASLIAKPALAQDDDVDARAVSRAVGILPDLADPEQDYLRTLAVLRHFGVPAQPSPQAALDSLSGLQTSANIQALLKYFDPGSEFSKYAALSATRMDFDQDRGAHQIPDFTARLRLPSVAAPVSTVAADLAAARSNPPAQPLLGLRIALDPGHMGGSRWDQITGKWIRDTDTGRSLSEGIINLQTALLLEQSFTRLGAQVMVTRHALVPVTSADYDGFDLNAVALYKLRESTLLDWFQNLVDANPIGEALYDSFSASPSFQDVFSQYNRWDDYNDLDLQARVDAIEAFHPDITLIIHYDVDVTDSNPHGLNSGPREDAVKAYVPGAFDPTELASRDDRAQFAMHLLDQSAWDSSVALAHDVVTTLSSDLGIPFDASSPGITTQVEPGVFSRDLYLLKKYQGSATAYVECLYYNDPTEFTELYDATHPMTIAGQNIPYSDRLAQVASSLQQAVLKFVQNGNESLPGRD